MKKTLENKLKDLRFRDLSESESLNAWNNIHARINPSALPLLANRKNMIPLLIGALIFASAGGTVAASNSAVPGDVLFPVDRAVENVRLAFARNGKAKLEVKFAEERLDEVDKLILRSRIANAASSTATSTATSTRATSTTPSKGRVAVGVNVAIDYLDKIAADLSASGEADAAAKIEAIISRLEAMVNDPDVKVALKQNGDFLLKIKGSNDNSTTSASSTATSTGKIKINTSGHKVRIEVKEEDDGRFKLELKDNGDLKIKTKVDDDDEDDDDDNKGKDRDDEDEDEEDDDEDDDDNATTSTSTSFRSKKSR